MYTYPLWTWIYKVVWIYNYSVCSYAWSVAIFLEFDYSAAADRLRNQLSTLIKLKYDAMMSSLFSKRVITDNERKEIDTRIGDGKMTYLIVDIILPSLNQNFSKKYKYFLQSLEESDDIDLKSTAEKLGKLNWHSIFCPFLHYYLGQKTVVCRSYMCEKLISRIVFLIQEKSKLSL